MLTEDLRPPKRQKLPTYLGRAKEKKKKQRQKNRDRTWPSGRELGRTKSFDTLVNPFIDRDGGSGGRGSSRDTEESKAIRVRRAKQRDYRTEDRCRPALTSLRGLSAPLPGQVGAGS